MLANNAPINAPYSDELTGLEVIAQVPDAHPTSCQYKKPAAAPIKAPIMVRLYFLSSVIL